MTEIPGEDGCVHVPWFKAQDPEVGTMRDWFAGHALVGLMRFTQGPGSHASLEQMAFTAYQMADAMMAERAKRSA
jgi:hypothetical protein